MMKECFLNMEQNIRAFGRMGCIVWNSQSSAANYFLNCYSGIQKSDVICRFFIQIIVEIC